MLQPPTAFQVTPDQVGEILSSVKWIVGGAMTGAGVIVAWLIALAFKMGGHVRELRGVSDNMTSIKANAEKVPVLENRIGNVEADIAHVVGTLSKHDSNIKDLLRGSRPDILPNGGE